MGHLHTNFDDFRRMNESSLSRVWKHVEDPGSTFGVVSAFRGDQSASENLEWHARLKKRVRELGYGFVEMRGGFKEEGGYVEELSLLVPGVTRDDIVALGQLNPDNEQYSVLYKDGGEFVEIGTNQAAGRGEVLNRFSAGRGRGDLNFDNELLQQFYSALVKGSHRGRKFLFNMEESVLEEKVPLSFNEVAYGRKKPGKDERWIRII